MVYWTEHEEEVDRIEKYAEIFKNDDGVSTIHKFHFLLVPSFYMLLYLTRLYNTAAAAAEDDDDDDDDASAAAAAAADDDDDDDDDEDDDAEHNNDDDHE